MEDIKVSVIVPVYGVEKFIARCIESILNQTLRGIELIIVDDATKDRSMQIADSVIRNHKGILPDIRIVRHEANKGLPDARNTGLSAARGEYVFHFDSDDYADPGMLAMLYDTAKCEDADIVWCDWFLTTENGDRYMKQPSYSSPDEAVRGMLGGAMKFNVWNKLVRRHLYESSSVEFPSGLGMGEDLTMIRLFANATRAVYVPMAFYHYVKTNTGAFSNTYSEKHLRQLRKNVHSLSCYLKEKFGNAYDTEIEFLKLEVKFPFLLMKDHKRFHKLWREWYPESNRFIKRNRYISSRSRYIQLFAKSGWFGVIRFYSFLLDKVAYKLIFNKSN